MAPLHPDADTILVVDDDEAVRGMITTILGDEGYEVLPAANGEDALAVAERHAAPIHLIVSDINMPLMGGWQLLEQLRRWYPSIRFLMVSGDMVAASPISELASTPTAFLAKPFTAQQLSGSVRELLDRPTRRSAAKP
jgi:two-component system cell cycle sensor histidine kinase/response regulator CckA